MTAWIKAHAALELNPETSWPIALSHVRHSALQDERGVNPLRNWLFKICSYTAHSLGADANAIAITLSNPAFSQVDGSITYTVEIACAGKGDPVSDAVASHLGDRIHQVMCADLGPFPGADILPRIPIDAPDAYLAKSLREVMLYLHAFAILPLSNHERLDLEHLLGLRDVISAVRREETHPSIAG